MNDRTSVNRQRIEAVCGSDDSLAIELLGMLVDEATPIAFALGEHARGKEAVPLQELAHSLKGIAGNVGAFELRDAATRLETVSAEDTTSEAVLAAAIAAITDALDGVRITHRFWEARAASHIGIFSA
jgi:HPt (histidine-containing phosphotransfer) domain-containing protein